MVWHLQILIFKTPNLLLLSLLQYNSKRKSCDTWGKYSILFVFSNIIWSVILYKEVTLIYFLP